MATESNKDPTRHFRHKPIRLLANYSYRLLFLIYIYSLIRVTQNEYLQYRYDARLFRYKHLSNSNSDWRARNELKSKLDEAYADLRAVGAPFINNRFGAEPALSDYDLAHDLHPDCYSLQVVRSLPLPVVQDSARLEGRATNLPRFATRPTS